MISLVRLVRNIALLLPLALLATGCAVASVFAAKVLPAEMIKPPYAGLAGQSVGVMVWVDRGLQVDYPPLSLDLANSIQKKLVGAPKTDELKGTIFPVQPASIARYQLDHPALDMRNVSEAAPHLGVTRLIYVEVEDFGTRAPASVELYRGNMTATLKVVETHGDQGHVGYEEQNIKATFPPKVPEDGTPDGDDLRFYAGTVDAMSTEIVNRLTPHEAPD